MKLNDALNSTSKVDFFNKVGPLDITPRVEVATLSHRFHVSLWEIRNRTIMGKTVADSWGVMPTKFWLSD